MDIFTVAANLECPKCGGPFDIVVGKVGHAPRHGSLALCKWCEAILRLVDGRLVGADPATLTPGDLRRAAIGRAMLREMCGPPPRSWKRGDG